MKIFTIGFTQSSAEDFFRRVRGADAKKLVDVRLNNNSQLAGFAKKNDLAYFTERLLGVPYEHRLELAPTEDMLSAFKKEKGSWVEYEKKFLTLLKSRQIERIAPQELDDACLLCSEAAPHHCHRRLVVEYLSEHWSGLEIVHL